MSDHLFIIASQIQASEYAVRAQQGCAEAPAGAGDAFRFDPSRTTLLVDQKATVSGIRGVCGVTASSSQATGC